MQALADFHFLRPGWLWLLLAVVAIALYFFNRPLREHGWARIIDAALIPYLVQPENNRQATGYVYWSQRAFALAAILAVLALAGPSWERQPQPVFQRSDSLVIILDLSLSMHARDIAPSRITRLRYKLLELLKQRREGDTALIAYSGDAHVVSPLTDDSNTIAALVPALNPEIMPSIGSNAVAAFEQAAEMLSNTPERGRRIAWFSDELLPGQAQQIQNLVAGSSAKLVVVGIGTAQGSPVPLPSGKFLKDSRSGEPVTAKFNPAPLMELAGAVNGRYIDLQADNRDIEIIIDNASLAIDKSDSTTGRAARQSEFDSWQDRGAWLIPLFLPLLLPCFRRGWIVCLFLALPVLEVPQANAANANADSDTGIAAEAAPDINSKWRKLWQRQDQRALSAFRDGDYERATELFEAPQWRGASSFYNQDFEAAQQHYRDAIESLQSSNAGSEETARAHYNLGHALAHNGKLDQALDAYKQALELKPDFVDAMEARDIVEQLLDSQQQSQTQSQQQPGNQQDDPRDSGETQQGEQGQAGEPSQPGRENQHGANSQQAGADFGDEQATAERDVELADRSAREQQENAREFATGDESSQAGSAREDIAAQEGPGDEDTTSRAQGMQANAGQDATLDPELQQWLNQIENDPSGLLRRKFLYERQLREREGTVIEPGTNEQLW